MPKVSILSSNYNQEKYLSKTIESVLSQDFNDFEYIIVDDGSSDRSIEMIMNYAKKDKRIRFYNGGRKGLVAQNNFLLSKVSDDVEYVTWIDMDDIYVVDNLSQRINIFQKYPEIVMLYNNFIHIDDNGMEFDRNYPEKLEKHFFPGIQDKMNISHTLFLLCYYKEIPLMSYGSLMFKKEFITSYGISNPSTDQWFRMSDLDLFYRIVSGYPSYGSMKKLLKYRVHGKQTSTKDQEKSEKNYHDLLKGLVRDKILPISDYYKCRII